MSTTSYLAVLPHLLYSGTRMDEKFAGNSIASRPSTALTNLSVESMRTSITIAIRAGSTNLKTGLDEIYTSESVPSNPGPHI